MTRPLALIEGALSLPRLRPFEGLPPPFGSQRRGAVSRPCTSLPRSRLPANARHILFYRRPQPRVDSRRFDVAMAEAKRYLEMGSVRPQSSRSDYMLGAAIFIACGMAMSWLLVTCSTHDSRHVEAQAQPMAAPLPTWLQVRQPGRPVVEAPVVSPRSIAEFPRSALQMANHSASAVQGKQVARAVTKVMTPVMQILPHARPMKPPLGSRPASSGHPVNLTDIADRVALSRTIHAAAASPHIARIEAPLPADTADTPAPWMNPPPQAYRTAPEVRAVVSQSDNWSTRLTQRRITDDPAAFNAN